jgi:hypothetical protein
MLKNLKPYFVFSVIATTSILAGCASSNVRHTPLVDNSANIQSEVDSSMANSVAGIDASLKTLVSVDRGNLPAPDKGPLRASVAYNASNTPAAVPMDVSKSVPMEGTQIYQNNVSMDTQVNTNQLSKKIKITWNGSSYELVKKISEAIGFSFYTVGNYSPLPDVKIKTSTGGDTVQDVLSQVANQITAKADINVNVSPVGEHPKSIAISYKQAK